MPKAKSSTSIGQSLLARTLTEWGVASAAAPRMVFSTRLADLIDISSAIELSDFFKLLKREQMSGDTPAPALLDAFRTQHGAIRVALDHSFAPNADSDEPAPARGFKLPEAHDNLLRDPDAFRPYARFYGLHQSELERRVALLRGLLLTEMRAHSDNLAKVAALDTALERLMVNFGRRCFAAIPNLLSRRFEQLRERQLQHDDDCGQASTLHDWLGGRGWLTEFHRDTHRLLYAELELRTEPLRGMLLALGHELPSKEYR